MNERNARFPSDLPMRVRRVRAMSVGLPVLYVIGGSLAALELGPAEGALGLLLIAAALLITIVGLQGTGVHRVTHEHAELLDDGERLIRDRVLAHAYRILAAVVVVGIVYADIGADINRKLSWSLPLPQADLLYTTGALILLSLLLPSALLAWRLPADEVVAD